MNEKKLKKVAVSIPSPVTQTPSTILGTRDVFDLASSVVVRNPAPDAAPTASVIGASASTISR